MSNQRSSTTDPDQAMVYRIRIKGHLDPQWENSFGGLTITLEDSGDTLLSGPVIDQAALHGLLRKVRDFGMPLISVNLVKSGHADGDLGNTSPINETYQNSSRKETQ